MKEAQTGNLHRSSARAHIGFSRAVIAGHAGAAVTRAAISRAGRRARGAVRPGKASPIAGAGRRAAKGALACRGALAVHAAGAVPAADPRRTASGARAEDDAGLRIAAFGRATRSGTGTSHVTAVGVFTAHAAQAGIPPGAIQCARARVAATHQRSTAAVWLAVHDAIEARRTNRRAAVVSWVDFAASGRAASVAFGWTLRAACARFSSSAPLGSTCGPGLQSAARAGVRCPIVAHGVGARRASEG